MTDREKFQIAELKLEVFDRDGWTCQCCGSPVNTSTAQLAHGIQNSKRTIEKYGKDIIHSKYNLKTACCLDCNARLGVGHAFEGEALQAIVDKIADEKQGLIF